jgi:hypothetical protein
MELPLLPELRLRMVSVYLHDKYSSLCCKAYSITEEKITDLDS